MQFEVYRVSEINTMVKGLLDETDILRDVLVQGEISNHKLHSSGHHYLTLKDEEAALPAVLFRFDAQRVPFKLENGMKIIAHGRIGSFVKTGQIQLYITDLIPDGVGALHVAFEQLKQKLYKQGLFNPENKKKLPVMPERIAIVTSGTGAAVHDMIQILRRRYPISHVVVYPVKVQGEGAAEQIADAILTINNYELAELIIAGRGGGSIEDLWAFNEEIVAHAIYVSEIPVISAVGHEPDMTIADLVADVRASTPSHAAEIAVPDQVEVRQFLQDMKMRLSQAIKSFHNMQKQRLDRLQQIHIHTNPKRRIQEQRLLLDHTSKQFASLSIRYIENRKKKTEKWADHFRFATATYMADKKKRYIQAVSQLDALSPLRVLERGYAMAMQQDGSIVTDSETIEVGERLQLHFFHGMAACIVEETRGEKDGSEKES